MATDNLTRILEEIGQMLGLGALEPDANESCQVMLPNGLSFQIELDPTQENVLIGIDIGDVPPGAYRGLLFEAALKDNATLSRQFGVLSFSEDLDRMLLWQLLPATSSGGEVFETLQLMLRKGSVWFEAIKAGNVPTLKINPEEEEEQGDGLFGIKL